VDVFLKDETVWLTQKALAELFGVKVPAINKHLKNIFDSGELLEPAVVSILETTAADGKNYQTRYYSLDAIPSRQHLGGHLPFVFTQEGVAMTSWAGKPGKSGWSLRLSASSWSRQPSPSRKSGLNRDLTPIPNESPPSAASASCLTAPLRDVPPPPKNLLISRHCKPGRPAMINKEHVTLRLNEDLLKKLDALSQGEGKNRSEVIEDLLSASLNPASPGPAPTAKIPPCPALLLSRLSRLEDWRQKNAAQAARHSRNFWWLTVPPMAINAAIAAGFGSLLGSVKFERLLLGVAAVLIFLDKERPQERLFSSFERAALELEELMRSLREQWEEGCLAGQAPDKLLAQILAAADKEEARVAKYLTDAESFLKEVTPARRLLKQNLHGLAILKTNE
jgi:uncharacterized protein (DUF4415 family)